MEKRDKISEAVRETVKELVRQELEEQKRKEEWTETLRKASPAFRDWYYGTDQAPNNGLSER